MSEAYVVVLSERFKGGVPDLYIQAPQYEGMFLELKWIETTKAPPYKVDLSPLQRNFMRRIHDAGGAAGWCLGTMRKGPGLQVYAGCNLNGIATKEDLICTAEIDAKPLMDRIGRGPWTS